MTSSDKMHAMADLSTALLVRPAVPDDAPTLVRLLAGLRAVETPFLPDKAEDDEAATRLCEAAAAVLLTDPEVLILFACAASDADRVLGYLQIRMGRTYLGAHRNPVALEGMYVEPESRRRGAASALLDEADKILKACGCDEQQTIFLNGNEPIAALFESRGFRPVATVYRRTS